MNKRFLLLVIDGLGVGEMNDIDKTRPQDKGAHTFGNILANKPGIKIPNLLSINIDKYFTQNIFVPTKYKGFNIALGKCKLAHFGADSFMGHQEIAGTKPKKPIRQFVRNEQDSIISALTNKGYNAFFTGKYILVNDAVAIADNIETDFGVNINVNGSLEKMSFDEILEIGKITRNVLKVGRVITQAGSNVNTNDFERSFMIKKRDRYVAWGIDIASLNIWNDNYHVLHMGYGIDPEKQIPTILTRSKIPVTLIGKAAHIIEAEGAKYLTNTKSEEVLKLIISTLKIQVKGLIFSNILETDLAGHDQNVERFANRLELIDKYIPKILSLLNDNDIFVITGDHGNDPTIGHTNHTREHTPIMLFSKNIKSTNLKVRHTLSDIGASIADFFNVSNPQNGTSFLDKVRKN